MKLSTITQLNEVNFSPSAVKRTIDPIRDSIRLGFEAEYLVNGHYDDIDEVDEDDIIRVIGDKHSALTRIKAFIVDYVESNTGDFYEKYNEYRDEEIDTTEITDRETENYRKELHDDIDSDYLRDYLIDHHIDTDEIDDRAQALADAADDSDNPDDYRDSALDELVDELLGTHTEEQARDAIAEDDYRSEELDERINDAISAAHDNFDGEGFGEWFVNNEVNDIDDGIKILRDSQVLDEFCEERGLVELDEAVVKSTAEDFTSDTGFEVGHACHGYDCAGDAKDYKSYTFETDAGGIEIVSPILTMDVIEDHIVKTFDFINSNGSTNNGTGLHVTMSFADDTLARLNRVKLAMLIGDQFLTAEFGRKGNRYTQSLVDAVSASITKIIRTQPSISNEEIERKLQSGFGVPGSDVGDGGKYRSANLTKSTGEIPLIEFRIMGSENYTDDVPKVMRHIERYAATLVHATSDDAASEKVYRTKLYKLIDSIRTGAKQPRIKSTPTSANMRRADVASSYISKLVQNDSWMSDPRWKWQASLLGMSSRSVQYDVGIGGDGLVMQPKPNNTIPATLACIAFASTPAKNVSSSRVAKMAADEIVLRYVQQLVIYETTNPHSTFRKNVVQFMWDAYNESETTKEHIDAINSDTETIAYVERMLTGNITSGNWLVGAINAPSVHLGTALRVIVRDSYASGVGTYFGTIKMPEMTSYSGQFAGGIQEAKRHHPAYLVVMFAIDQINRSSRLKDAFGDPDMQVRVARNSTTVPLLEFFQKLVNGTAYLTSLHNVMIEKDGEQQISLTRALLSIMEDAKTDAGKFAADAYDRIMAPVDVDSTLLAGIKRHVDGFVEYMGRTLYAAIQEQRAAQQASA